MKRFSQTLLILCVFFVVTVVAMHIVDIVRLQSSVDSVYTLTPAQKYLFLGSSQVGCGIEESANLHNKVLWVSDTTILHALVRLRELDRRKQLRHVKVVAIPFNFVVLQQYSERTLKWGWYQELPVAYRHFDIYPFSLAGFLGYVASNLRWPFHMVAKSAYPVGRPAIRQRPEAWRQKFLVDSVRSASQMAYGKGCCAGWEEMLKNHLIEMKAICDRHGIRFVVFRMPVLPQFEGAVPDDVLQQEGVWFRFLEGLGCTCVTPNEKNAYDDTKFFDTVHFMEPGTAAFAQDIMMRIEEVLQ